MSMGVGLAAMTLWQLWRAHDSSAAARQALDASGLAASMYWLTNTPALAYPGAKWVDPPGTATFPQWKFVLPSLLLVAVGYTLERRRLGHPRRSGVMSATGLVAPDRPALATTTSMPPNRSIAASNNWLTVSGSVRSPGTVSTWLPRLSRSCASSAASSWRLR